MLFGYGEINVLQDKDYDCKIFPFDPEFSSDDVYVQLAVTSKTYDAAVTWIGGASKSGYENHETYKKKWLFSIYV